MSAILVLLAGIVAPRVIVEDGGAFRGRIDMGESGAAEAPSVSGPEGWVPQPAIEAQDPLRIGA